MNWIEVVGTILGVTCVFLGARGSVWNWPIGIVQVVLFTIMFAQKRLYAEVINHTYFFVTSVYGWYEWARGGPRHSPLPVRRLSRRGQIVSVACVVVGAPLIGWPFARWTNAVYPYLDSIVTAGSLVAQALMTRKVLESWLFWMFIDVIAIGIYIARGLYLTAGLYCVYLILCVFGWRRWKKQV